MVYQDYYTFRSSSNIGALQSNRIIVENQLHVSRKRYLPVGIRGKITQTEREGRLLHFQLPGTRLRRRTGKISSTTWRLHFRYLSPISAHECAWTENNGIECSNEIWGMKHNKRLYIASLCGVVYKVLNFTVDRTIIMESIKVE